MFKNTHGKRPIEVNGEKINMTKEITQISTEFTLATQIILQKLIILFQL